MEKRELREGDYIGVRVFSYSDVLDNAKPWFYVEQTHPYPGTMVLPYRQDGHTASKEVPYSPSAGAEIGIPPMYVCSKCHGNGHYITKEKTIGFNDNAEKQKYFQNES